MSQEQPRPPWLQRCSRSSLRWGAQGLPASALVYFLLSEEVGGVLLLISVAALVIGGVAWALSRRSGAPTCPAGPSSPGEFAEWTPTGSGSGSSGSAAAAYAVSNSSANAWDGGGGGGNESGGGGGDSGGGGGGD